MRRNFKIVSQSIHNVFIIAAGIGGILSSQSKGRKQSSEIPSSETLKPLFPLFGGAEDMLAVFRGRSSADFPPLSS